MNTHKLLTVIKLTTLMAIVTIMMVGCQATPLVTDYAIAPTLSKTSAGQVYPNSTVQLKLDVKSDIEGEVNVEYLASGVSGTLMIETKTVRIGDQFKHDFSKPLYLSFTPYVSGSAKLQFRITNERATTEAKVDFAVNRPAYEFVMLSDTTVQVGTKESLAFVVHELETKAPETKAGGTSYTITARITKGRGILQVKDQVLVDDSQTELATKSDAPISVDIIKDQETPFYYTSLTSGENNIDFSVIDQYGNAVNTPVKMQAATPVADFKFSLKQDSTYKAAVFHEFTIFPDTKGIPLDLKMSWTIAPKSEIQDIAILNKTLPLPAGSQVSIKDNSATPMSVITQSKGRMGIAFQFEDKYGTKSDTTIFLTIASPSIDFSFPSTFPELSEWKAYEWVGNLLLESGTNAYQIKYENEDPDAGDLTINGTVPVHGENADMKSAKNLFKYLPRKVGTHKLLFTVSDKFKNEETYPVTFTVKSNSLNSTVDKVAPVNYSQSVNINVNIPSQDHIKAFKGLVSSLDGGSATLEVNGSKVSENGEFALKSGTNVFKVTPTKIAAEYKFKLLVKSDIGQEQAHEVVVPIIIPDMSAKLTTMVGECDLTGTLIYELTLSQPHYEGSYSITPSIISKTGGKISIAGKDVGNNLTAKISKSGTVPIVFTPAAKDDNIQVNLRIADENGQDTVLTLKGKVTTPKLSVTATPSSATIKYKTLTRFTVTIAEALHPEKFQFTPKFIKGSGALTMENKPIVPGVMTELAAGTYNFTYTPDDCGEVEIEFKAMDKYVEKAVTSSIIFTVEPSPLIFTMNDISASEVNITVPVTFSLEVDEIEAPDSPYTLSYTTTNKGTLKLGESVIGAGTSKVLTKGAHSFSYTPTATGSHSVTFTLLDMFGQQKTATLNVDAKNAPLNASASASSLSTAIKTAANFTISANEADYTDDFKLKVTNSENGVLTMNGTALTFGQEVNLRSGTTTMAYTPNAIGDHTLSFVVKDKYNQSKEFSVQVHADYADMRVGATGPASMYLNRNATIALSLAEDNYTDDFKVVWTGGTGIMKNGATVYTSGTGYSIAGGSSSLTYTPTTTGDHVLKFMITDKYGQSKEASVTINVLHAPISASATAPSSMYISRNATIALSLAEDNYTGNFTVVWTGGMGVMKNGATVYTSGTGYSIAGGSSNLTYAPTTIGAHVLKFVITDSYGQSKETSVTINVSHAALSASATAPGAMYINRNATIALSLSEVDYTGNFTVAWSGGSGVIKNGATVYTSGADYPIAGGSSNLTYTPTTTGAQVLTFKITDSYGQSKNANVTINVSQAPLSVSTTPASTSVYTGSVATTTLSIGEAEHNAQFTIRPTISGNGTLTINGSNVGSGGSIRVNGGNQSIGFTAATSGSHSVTFNVDDANGQTKPAMFTVTANEPEIVASVTSPSIYTYQSGEVLLNLSKPNYTGTYSVSISRTGSGTFLFDGRDPGSSITVGNGVARFAYTPNIKGNHSVTFTIRASDGKTTTVTSNMSVNHSPLRLSIANSDMSIKTEVNSGGLTNLTPHPIIFSAHREHYPSSKKLTITLVSITNDNANSGMGNTVTAYYLRPNNSLLHESYTWQGNGSSLTVTETYIKAVHQPDSPKNDTVRYKMTFKVTDEDGQTDTAVLECRVNPW